MNKNDFTKISFEVLLEKAPPWQFDAISWLLELGARANAEGIRNPKMVLGKLIKSQKAEKYSLLGYIPGHGRWALFDSCFVTINHTRRGMSAEKMEGGKTGFIIIDDISEGKTG